MSSVPEEITMDEYGHFVKTSSFYAHAGKRDEKELCYLSLGLGGEAGETVDVVKKIVRDSHNDRDFRVNYNQRVDSIADEAGDVLWYLQGLCNFLGITIEELAQKNAYKLCSRHKQLWKSSGLTAASR